MPTPLRIRRIGAPEDRQIRSVASGSSSMIRRRSSAGAAGCVVVRRGGIHPIVHAGRRVRSPLGRCYGRTVRRAETDGTVLAAPPVK